MARRYTRDNRGRFASVGATARGGRLRTAAGNKRETQTARIAVGRAAGTVGKPKGLKADPNAAVKLATNQRLRARAAARAQAMQPAQAQASTKPGRQRVRGNFRPQNLYSGTTKPNQFGKYGTDAKSNVLEARKQIQARGVASKLESNRRSSSVAFVRDAVPNTVFINASHSTWSDPGRSARRGRASNQFSTSSPGHVVAHELGHVTRPVDNRSNWTTGLMRGRSNAKMPSSDQIIQAQKTARRVSKYAMQNPSEFAAETKAALSLGKKYDSQVMRQFRQVTGRRSRSLRSQLRK